VAVLLALAASGCGSSGTSDDSPAAASAAASPTVAQSPPGGPDARTCADVAAIIGHMSADTARWAPNLRPFDPAISARIRTLAGDLDQQTAKAQVAAVRTSVHQTAVAFVGVADAMKSKRKKAVLAAIDQSRVAYRQLKAACELD
jgi:hypothetical protein